MTELNRTEPTEISRKGNDLGPFPTPLTWSFFPSSPTALPPIPFILSLLLSFAYSFNLLSFLHLTLSQHGAHSRLQNSLWVGAHRTPVYTLRNKESDALFPSLISELRVSGEAEDLFSCHYHGLA